MLDAQISSIKLEPMDQDGGGSMLAPRTDMPHPGGRSLFSHYDYDSAVLIKQENTILKQQLQVRKILEESQLTRIDYYTNRVKQ